MAKVKLEDLQKQRQSIQSKLDSFTTYVEKLGNELETNKRGLQEIEIAQLDIRQTKINELYTKFDSIQDSIETQTSLDNLQKELKIRSELEDKFCNVQSTVKFMLYSSKPKTCSSPVPIVSNQIGSVNLKSVKLPVIDLPKFDGNYNKWLEYRDSFESVIHNNNSLDDILKFQYLKSSLVGDAAKTVNFLETSAGNYGIAWKSVCERFNKPRLLVNNHIKALFNIKPANSENAKEIRNIINEASQHLRALELLKQPVDSWDSVLIHLITSKLDSDTMRDWESSIKDNELPSKKQLFKFLNEKADTLENVNVNAVNKSQSRYCKSDSHYKNTTRVYLSTNSEQKCSFCKKEHKIIECNEFLKLKVEKRIENAKAKGLCINCLRLGHFIKDCRSGLCRKCGHKHNTLLHIDKFNQTREIRSNADTNNETKELQTQCSLVRYTSEATQTLLATVIVNVLDANGKIQQGRALLDSGSQSNLITSKFCNLLGLEKTPVQISLTSIGTVTSNLNSKCSAILKSRCSDYSRNTSFFVVSSICNQLPNFRINDSKIDIPDNIILADPKFGIPSKIDMLLGASIFWDILETNQVKLGKNLPILQHTKLGYIVTGPIPQISSNIYCNFVKINDSNDNDIQAQLSKFWEIEECLPKRACSIEEKMCEEHFKTSTRRDKTGRFVVSIPFKDSIDKLGDSRQGALNQFNMLEKRLDKNQPLRILYTEFIREYLELGHMSTTNSTDSTKSYFMPHHGVVKAENLTTKLRVVFNASATTTSGASLNDLQMVGPTIQSDLFSILIRFREHAYVACADVSKMYRQVLVTPEQRPLQKILWRFSSNEPIKEYSLNTVTYGTASAPYLAIRCLFQLAEDNVKSNERASVIIKEDMYVDDLITGDDDVDQLAQICNAVTHILQSGGFTLRKWKSNETEVLDQITSESNETFMKEKEVITKRVLLSLVSQIFDPLGLLAACTVTAKIILQKLWLEKLTWDDPVPEVVQNMWRKFETELQTLNTIKIPRYAFMKDSNKKEIHAFCDASKDAYGACVYIRAINSHTGEIVSNLLCAKSKVAPLKPLSTPRLELCAALIAARLVNKILKVSRQNFDNCTLWSDSTIVLSWIKTAPNLLKCFVSNRIAEIQDLTKELNWRYVNTKENPADILSRGICPSQIQDSSTWWHGPDWLTKDESLWPKLEFTKTGPVPETRIINAAITNVNETDLFSRFSNINRMKRVIAYCFRFFKNCRHPKTERQFGPLTLTELNETFSNIIKVIQIKLLPLEYEYLRKNKEIPKSSNILSLKPFLNSKNVMCVGGRLEASQFSYEKKHPIILPQNHITELLFKAEHIRLLHAGPQQVLYSIRERFWPISVHLELVTDLTKDAFIAAFRRFVARRGLPTEVNSDNGTSFIGARNELNELGKFITSNRESIEEKFNSEGIKWKFIPPRSPHMGGLWKAGIRSAKHHIKRVARISTFTYEEFSTLLCQIEAVLNSRPLSNLSTDPLDPIPLTPSHFLLGRATTSPPDPDLKHVSENRMTTYQRIQQTNQHFWARWSKEYVSELQQRTKWKTNCKNLELNTVVLLKEDSVPPLCWPIGVVTELHAGNDGTCRVATVRTAQGLFKRPVIKLCPLPSDSDECNDVKNKGLS